jgi:hypothetical protein
MPPGFIRCRFMYKPEAEILRLHGPLKHISKTYFTHMLSVRKVPFMYAQSTNMLTMCLVKIRVFFLHVGQSKPRLAMRCHSVCINCSKKLRSILAYSLFIGKLNSRMTLVHQRK